MSFANDRPAGAVLGAATVTTGLMAGLFYAFDISVMPGLGRTDDRTFVSAMRSINEAIENPLFATTYAAALALPVTAGVMQWRAGNRRAARWIAAGVIGYGAALALTSRVNVPLNKELGSGRTDLRALRDDFETLWSSSNTRRTAACTVAFACLVRALALHGRP
jgi:uncharacterized membrane protein